MKKETEQQENGQALIIMVFALVALLGFVALAIDGGRAMTERRKAQNAADAAAMAAVRELGSGASSFTAREVAVETARANGYNLDEASIIVSDEKVDYGGGYNPDRTAAYIVEIDIDSGVESTFAQFIFDQFVSVGAYAEMEVRLRNTPLAGFGLVSLGSTCSTGGGANGAGVGASGGGGSGGIIVYDSSILVNASNADCAYYPPNSGDGIWACIGAADFEPGDYDNAGEACTENGGTIVPLQAVNDTDTCGATNCDNMSPVDGGFEQQSDPLAGLPAPTCPNSGTVNPTKVNGRFQPGYYTPYHSSKAPNGLTSGEYAPGMYCVTVDKDITNEDSFGPANPNGIIDASSGVMFYLYDSGDGAPNIDATHEGLDLKGIGNGDELNCTDDPDPWGTMDTSDPCNYKGMAIFVQQDKSVTLDLGGNGQFNTWGTIYGNEAVLNAHGGGSDTDELEIRGQAIIKQATNDGGGSLQVWYVEEYSYTIPPYINTID